MRKLFHKNLQCTAGNTREVDPHRLSIKLDTRFFNHLSPSSFLGGNKSTQCFRLRSPNFSAQHRQLLAHFWRGQNFGNLCIQLAHHISRSARWCQQTLIRASFKTRQSFAMVGTSGAEPTRCALEIAKARIRPDFMVG